MRIFDARRKPIPLALPEPLPRLDRREANIMHYAGYTLTDWMKLTPAQRAEIRWNTGANG